MTGVQTCALPISKAAALSVEVTDEKAEFARLFGENIGICFQIKDDIFYSPVLLDKLN